MPLTKLKLLLLPVLWFFILMYAVISPTTKLISQTSNAYESLSTAQGLSQGMVFDILQDKEGFIWIATKNGLNRYDGYSFTVFTNDPYNPHSLSSNTILALFEDSKGRIWVGTENAGLNVYDKKMGQFHRIIHSPKNSNSISGNRIRAPITELSDGRVLVSTEGSGFNIITLPNNFFEKDTTPGIIRISLPGKARVHGAGKDKNGSVWIEGMDKAVYSFNLEKNSLTKLKQGKFLNSGYLTADGNIWINRNFFLWNGKTVVPLFDARKAGNIILNSKYEPWMNFHLELFYYDIAKWQPGKLIKWNEGLKIDTGAKVLSPFIIDRSGMLWAGTQGYGLRKYNIAANKFNLKAPGFSVRYIVPESSNKIIIGNYPEEWWRVINDSIQKSIFNSIALTKHVDNVILSKTGDYWFRSDSHGMFKYNFKTTKLTRYSSISFAGNWDKQPMMEDTKGAIWYPLAGGIFARVFEATDKVEKFTINNNPAKPMLPRALCTALYEDGEGIFWIGTEEGFVKADFKHNYNSPPAIKWFYNNSNNRNSLNYNYVSCFLDDPAAPNQYLWICTKGGGLNRMDKTNGNFIHLTKKDGLPDDAVYGILADNAGNIWGSTNKGIFCMTALKDSGWSFRNFTKADGLQDDEFNTGAYAKLPDGNLAFGGVNGLNIFNPKEVLITGFKPNVFITNILVNNQPVSPGDKSRVLQNTIEQTKNITLTYLQDILTLEFSSLDFTKPDQNKYRYKLKGADKDWIESGTRRTATYLHLPAGKYTFEVQGTNSQAIWSDKIAKLDITVLPPWWRTWWAYTLYTLLFASAIFFITRAQQQRLFQKEQHRNKLLELEMQALRAQMNPHFIFNCLSAINSFVISNETEEASDYLIKFSRLIRLVLNNSKQKLISLEEELEMLQLYIDMEQLRFPNGFTYSIQVEDNVEQQNIFIPPLLLQPFAENAVWHGLMHKNTNGQLVIRLSIENSILNFEIEDNGIGRAAAAGFKSRITKKNKSLGLQITKDRLSLINGYTDEKTFFEIVDLFDRNGNAAGTRVILKIKFSEAISE